MPLIIPSNSISAGGYEIDNSLRFDDGSSDYLSKTLSTPTDGKKFTFSGWLKKCDTSNSQTLFSTKNSSTSNRSSISFNDGRTIRYFEYQDGTGIISDLETDAVYRDVSAWYHIVVSVDTTQATAADRQKIYINGTQVTDFSTETYISQNTNTYTNSSTDSNIGRYIHTSSLYFDGYMAEVCMIDGQQLDPTSFGEFDEDSGIWKPIDVSGLTFGTNGFYLDFENSGSLGADVSGNGNNFTVNNLTSIDQTTDTPTNNWCTINPLDKSSDFALSEGNLKVASGGSNYGNSRSTFAVSTGKWYWEAKVNFTGTAHTLGITTQNSSLSTYLGNDANDYAYARNGTKWNNNSSSAYGDSYTIGDIIGIALDLDGGTLTFYKNGVSQGTAFSSLSGEFFPAFGDIASEDDIIWLANFGNPPFTISSGNSDGNGYGNFEYAVPSGYYALNTKNLAEYG